MAENVPPAGANGDVPGQPFYEKTRQHLKELLHKRRILERSLAAQEDAIYKKETEYLEETPSGNIITGFESYTKGTSSTAPNGARRKGGISESNRVFSRSSTSYNANAVRYIFWSIFYLFHFPIPSSLFITSNMVYIRTKVGKQVLIREWN